MILAARSCLTQAASNFKQSARAGPDHCRTSQFPHHHSSRWIRFRSPQRMRPGDVLDAGHGMSELRFVGLSQGPTRGIPRRALPRRACPVTSVSSAFELHAPGVAAPRSSSLRCCPWAPRAHATGSDTTRWLTCGSQLTPPCDRGRGTGNPDDNPGVVTKRCRNANDINKLGRITPPSLGPSAPPLRAKVLETARGDEHGTALARSGQAGGGSRAPCSGLRLVHRGL